MPRHVKMPDVNQLLKDIEEYKQRTGNQVRIKLSETIQEKTKVYSVRPHLASRAFRLLTGTYRRIFRR